jgi:serine/threonine protein kinase
MVEMAVALGNQGITCQLNHKSSLQAVCPSLSLETMQEYRLSEEDIRNRLAVGNRVGAGGFSHIYLGKFKAKDVVGAEGVENVAVKEYIQRKPVFFSLDTPEEREAKELEMEQGAIVVFRRLHHEVGMLGMRKLVYVEEGLQTEKDCSRILQPKAFSFKPPYVLTPYYEMGDLYRILHNSFAFKDLDSIWLIGVAVDISRGMRFLERCSPPLCHRDLKTPNIYVVSMDPNAHQRAVVGDLGTCVPMFGRTRIDIAPITNPIWMAPELIQKKPYGASVDSYSFGVVMWELLTRTHPFTHFENDEQGVDDRVALRKAIVRGERPPLPNNCVFGQDYLTLIKSCWAANPDDRPTFKEIVPALVVIKNRMVGAQSNAVFSVQ